MKVAIGDVDLDAARKTAAELGPSAVALPLDVTDRESFAAFLDDAEQQLGPVDVLINNAGIMQIGRFIDEDDLTARRMVDINIHGVILGMKLALERMVPRDRGHIVNISSQAGKFGAPGGATYSATKHAVVGLTEAVRGELRLMDAHIDLSYVMPFVVNTELGGGLGRGARAAATSSPPTSPTRSSRRCSTAPSKCGCPSRPSARTCSATVLPRRLSEGMARAMKADRVLADADTIARASYELRAVALGARPGGGRRAAADPQLGRPGSRRRARRRRRTARSLQRLSRRSASRRSGCRSAGPGPPAGSGSRPRSAAAPGGRSPRRSARRPCGGRIGSESAHSISVGRRSSRSASSTRWPAAAPGASGARGISSGNARAPALDAASG